MSKKGYWITQNCYCPECEQVTGTEEIYIESNAEKYARRKEERNIIKRSKQQDKRWKIASRNRQRFIDRYRV